MLQLDMFQFFELILTLGASFIFANVMNYFNIGGGFGLLEDDKNCNKMQTTAVN